VDLETGELLWSRLVTNYAGHAAFTADSQRLLVTNAEQGCDIGVLCAKTGRTLARWVDGDRLAKGVAVAGDDTAIAWKQDGTIAEFDLSRGSVRRRYRPRADGRLQPVAQTTGDSIGQGGFSFAENRQ
jgi:hypothetical protein